MLLSCNSIAPAVDKNQDGMNLRKMPNLEKYCCS